MVEVLHHGTKVHLEDGLMNFLFQSVRNLFEVEGPCSLDEYDAVADELKLLALQQLLCLGIESAGISPFGKAVLAGA